VEAFGKTLRHYRKHRRMTQTELAGAVGVAPAYVSQIESSLRVPSLRVARRIAEVLHVELPALLGAEPERTSPDRLTDGEKLEMLRSLVRSIEQDMEARPVREAVETYPGSKGARLGYTPELVVRSYAFRAAPPVTQLHVHEGHETVHCACGRAFIRFDDGEERTLEAGDAFRFDASRPHVVLGAEGTIVVSTASPPPTAETLRRVAVPGSGIRVDARPAGTPRGVLAG
jgi:transcriptional regulator with XRE-family HTH domain